MRRSAPSKGLLVRFEVAPCRSPAAPGKRQNDVSPVWKSKASRGLETEKKRTHTTAPTNSATPPRSVIRNVSPTQAGRDRSPDQHGRTNRNLPVPQAGAAPDRGRA